MANKNLFSSTPRMRGRRAALPPTNTVNEAGGQAYALEPMHALAQYASTGCLNQTYYASGDQQLDMVLALVNSDKVNPRFVAKTAIYARQRAYMKDLPALLLAVLAKRDVSLLKRVFFKVIDNGKMLRNFVQIIRSGKVGRKSLGTAPKKLIQNWLESRHDDRLLEASIGNDPSLKDIIKLTHPKATSASRNAFYAYLTDKEHRFEDLPEIVRHYEDYKAKRTAIVPEVPHQLLTSLELGTPEWTEIAKNAAWHATRMNLNTFKRHGVFNDEAMIRMVADKLRDREKIQKAKIFPYQLMAAYLNVEDMPHEIKEALQDAMEIALENVPEVDGQVYVFPDVSGSMSMPATGSRGSATSKVRCIDIAALVAAAFIRKNPGSGVIPFEQTICLTDRRGKTLDINPRDSVMTNATKLASIGGGGTNCSAPLAELNRRGAKADLVVYVSDNESWVDSGRWGSTSTMVEWEKFKRSNPQAKMVCIDIQAYGSTQAKEQEGIMNIGGFSDDVFMVINEFVHGRLGSDHWVGEIEKIPLS